MWTNIIKFFRHIWWKITSFFFHTKRAFQFMKLGWEDNDWDYSYLWKIEMFKLKCMQNYFEHSNIAEGNKQRAEKLKLAISLLNIAMGEDSVAKITDKAKPIGEMEWELTGYVNTKNASRYFNESQLKMLFDKSKRCNIIMTDDLRVEKAWHCYCKLIENNFRNWWD